MDIWALIASISFMLAGGFGGMSFSLEGTESREKAWKVSILLFNMSTYVMVIRMYQHVMK